MYITEGIIKYRVDTRKLETNSNYNIGISIKMVGENFPEWGTTIKSTDNARKYAKEVIKTWAKQQH